MLGRWLELSPAQDGPFWALNLMKYRAVARYADGRAEVSGREADDAYAPLGPLAAVGAMVAFHAEVDRQRSGEPTWDRVGIVRYPNRAAFFAMQQRDDFKAQHVHKEAGMDTTIVLACRPTFHATVEPMGTMAVLVERADQPVSTPMPAGARPFADFEVEGVIVGDDRRWSRAVFLWADDEAVDALAARPNDVGEPFVVTLSAGIDRLTDSIETAGSIEAPAT
jgi:hypothetical protein